MAEVTEPISWRVVVFEVEFSPLDALETDYWKRRSRDSLTNATALSAYTYATTSSPPAPHSCYACGHLAALGSLASEVPVVQISTTSTQIRGKSQPAQVRHKSIASSLIDLAPDVDKPSGKSSESKDISSGLDGTAEAEEQRRPDQVETELDGVEGGAVSCEGDGAGVGAGGADGPRAVGSVAHQAVEESPCWAEDPSWRASGAAGC